MLFRGSLIRGEDLLVTAPRRGVRKDRILPHADPVLSLAGRWQRFCRLESFILENRGSMHGGDGSVLPAKRPERLGVANVKQRPLMGSLFMCGGIKATLGRGPNH